MKILNAAAMAALMLSSVSTAQAETALPALKAQATAEAAVAEHVDALNNCDWDRLIAQYPEDGQFFLSNTVIDGRAAIGELFAGFCKDHADGGLNGLKFTAVKTTVIGDTIVTLWSGEAPFLAEPYMSSDAYITKDGLIQTQVSTFDGAALKMK
ncbi:MAG: nuclear transport factor 2 family protein [Devosia sp.]